MRRLEGRSLHFSYVAGSPAIRDVSLHVDAGEILFLLGSNGSGKSSLLGVLAGALRPESGTVVFEGRDLTTMTPPQRARRIGLVPQLHVASFGYGVLEMVLLGRAPHLATFAVPSADDEAIACDALARVGLVHLRERRYTDLSGGERQLVLIARGLAQRCDVLLMDEPDAHLDPRNALRVLEVVHELARGAGVSFVIASHAPNSALAFADRVLLLARGRTLACGSVASTLTPPLLEAAYEMRFDVLSDAADDGRVVRAVVVRRGA